MNQFEGHPMGWLAQHLPRALPPSDDIPAHWRSRANFPRVAVASRVARQTV
jgi:hypothetical protein